MYARGKELAVLVGRNGREGQYGQHGPTGGTFFLNRLGTHFLANRFGDSFVTRGIEHELVDRE